MKKVFIIDTNVLLSNPDSIFKFDDNDVVIPISVIEEIDKFKKDQSETGRNARQVSRILDKLRAQGTLSSGIPILADKHKNPGLLFVYLGRDLPTLPGLLSDLVDNNILAIALTLQKKFGTSRKVTIITKDSNLRIKSDAFGISSEDLSADKVLVNEVYTGMGSLEVDAKSFFAFKEQGFLHMDADTNLYPNQFISLINKEDEKFVASGVFDKQDNKIKSLNIPTENIWGISSRNQEQEFALWALLNDKINLVTLTGGAGTGKTLMAIAAGLAKTTDEEVFNRLLIARPIFPMGRDIGFLPGDLNEKLNPWMQPVYDSLDFLLGGGSHSRKKRFSKSYEELINQGLLAVEPLTYIRGRSLPLSYFVVDESQNLTPHEIKTIITRAGEGTKIVLTGDPFQIDNPYVDSTNNGLTHVVERFKDLDIAAHVTFQQGERSKLATLAAQCL
jgi:PhoH-like ATPase